MSRTGSDVAVLRDGLGQRSPASVRALPSSLPRLSNRHKTLFCQEGGM